MSLALRAVVLLIALAGAWDPALTVSRPEPVTIGVRRAAVQPDVVRAIEASIARATAGRARVVAETGAAGGDWCREVDICVAFADGTADLVGTPARSLLLVDVGAPSAVQAIAAAAWPGHPLERSLLRVWITGGRPGDDVPIAVEVGGVTIDRVTHARGSARVEAVDLTWWPDAAYTTPRVRIGDAADAPALAVSAEIAPAPAEVLVWDGRPSWQGTFVRRALAADPRLVVRAVHEVTPARRVRQGLTGVPTDDDLSRAQVVLVGGAERLGATAVGRLERYVRGGGAVIVALDDAPSGPITRLLPEVAGDVRRSLAPIAISSGWRAGEVQPFAPRDGDVALATIDGRGGVDVVVERPLGRGRVVVSGALDGWRWRDDGFDRFWTDTVVRLARASGPPAAVRPLPAGVGRDGGRFAVVQRGVADGASWPAIAMPASSSLRARPSPSGGAWIVDVATGTAPLPLDVAVGDRRASAAWHGATTIPAAPPSWPRLERLAVVSGGRVIAGADAVTAMAAAVDAVRPRPVPVTWYPMRAWWWFVPVALALGVDWWRRRRAGRA